ncbi:diguanylate cyclase domain-containing protein [Paraburkholderia sp. GAS42]|uniref:diguanylate cyclase domain-containing protein n=1 Tax=Paraburkholderia sp. GAS42 TaxID=3035135 RepID=UPI003D205C33
MGQARRRLLARTDGLTRPHNRCTFAEVAQTEWRHAQWNRHPLSMLPVDAACFTGFSDLYGNAVGNDAVGAVRNRIDLLRNTSLATSAKERKCRTCIFPAGLIRTSSCFQRGCSKWADWWSLRLLARWRH